MEVIKQQRRKLTHEGEGILKLLKILNLPQFYISIFCKFVEDLVIEGRRKIVFQKTRKKKKKQILLKQSYKKSSNTLNNHLFEKMLK